MHWLAVLGKEVQRGCWGWRFGIFEARKMLWRRFGFGDVNPFRKMLDTS